MQACFKLAVLVCILNSEFEGTILLDMHRLIETGIVPVYVYMYTIGPEVHPCTPFIVSGYEFPLTLMSESYRLTIIVYTVNP